MRRVWGLGFRVQGLVWSLMFGFETEGLGFRRLGLEFGVWVLRFEFLCSEFCRPVAYQTEFDSAQNAAKGNTML